MIFSKTPGTFSTAPTFEQLRATRLSGTKKSAVDEFFEVYRQLTPPFQALLDHIFAQPGVWTAFMHGPSSRQGHHCGRGGNLRHSVDVARISLALAADAAVKHLIDTDVVIVSALVHDLGKTQEYETGSRDTKMSPLGRLVGHKFTGFGMTWAPLHNVPGIGERQRLAILNCLSSSPHGMAWGARGPACLEAQIVSHADQLSASTDLFRASQVASRNAGFGVRHEHQRETPYHVTPLPLRTPVAPAARPSLEARLNAALKASRHYFSTSRRA